MSVFEVGDAVKLKEGWGYPKGGIVGIRDLHGLYTIISIPVIGNTCFVLRTERDSWETPFEIAVDQLEIVERKL